MRDARTSNQGIFTFAFTIIPKVLSGIIASQVFSCILKTYHAMSRNTTSFYFFGVFYCLTMMFSSHVVTLSNNCIMFWLFYSYGDDDDSAHFSWTFEMDRLKSIDIGSVISCKKSLMTHLLRKLADNSVKLIQKHVLRLPFKWILSVAWFVSNLRYDARTNYSIISL